MAELAQGFLSSLFGHPGGFDLLAELFNVLLLVEFAQLLLDRLHLLAQVVLALALRHLVLNVGLDFRPELLELDLARQLPVQTLQAAPQIEALEQFLLLGRRERRQVGGDEVRQAARIVDVHDHRLEVVRKHGRELNHLLEQRGHAADQRVKVRLLLAGHNVVERLHAGAQVGLHLDDFLDGDSLQALHEDEKALAGQLDDLVNVGRGSDLVEVNRLRVVDARVALGDHADELVLLLAQVVNQLQRAFPTHRERQNGVREQHRIANRQNGQFLDFGRLLMFDRH